MAKESRGLSLAARINQIKAEVGVVNKSGFNSFHQFRFATHDDILAAVVPLMHKHGVCLRYLGADGPPLQTEAAPTRAGKPQHRTLIGMKYGVVNVDDPEDQFLFTAYGESIDSEDKGLTKALTSGSKYAYMRLFDVRTGDVQDEVDAHAPAAGPIKVLGEEAASRLRDRAKELKISKSILISAIKKAGGGPMIAGHEEEPEMWPAEIVPLVKKVLDDFAIPAKSAEPPFLEEFIKAVEVKWEKVVQKSDLARPGVPQSPRELVQRLLEDYDTFPGKDLKDRVINMTMALNKGDLTLPDGEVIPF